MYGIENIILTCIPHPISSSIGMIRRYSLSTVRDHRGGSMSVLFFYVQIWVKDSIYNAWMPNHNASAMAQGSTHWLLAYDITKKC